MARREKPVDVVIVGVGWTGGIMAKELAKAGFSVVGIERGAPIEALPDYVGISSHDELANRRGKVFDLSKSTVTVRNTMAETARPMRRPGPFSFPDGVGGAGNYWATACFRQAPWDFRLRSATIERYGAAALPEICTSQDWPITFEDLELHYDHYERDIGVAGKAGNLRGEIIDGGNPFEGPRSREYPNPPSPNIPSQELFTKVVTTLGYHPYPAPRATMTQAYTNPDGVSLNACMYCGHCSGFTCEMNAKATPVSTVLPTALATGRFVIRANSTVIRVNLDSTGRKATGVTYIEANGQEVEQPADIVILAGFTFANVQLLLVSKIGEPYDPKTGKGHVGRNYSWHNSAPNARLVFDDRLFSSFMGAGGLGTRMSDLQGDNFDHAGLGFIGGAAIGVYQGGDQALGGGPIPPGTPNFGSAWKKASGRYFNRTLEITGSHDMQSYADNYLDLDPTYKDKFGLPLLRVTYDNHSNEKKAVSYCAAKMQEICKAIAPTNFWIKQIPDHFGVDGGTDGSQHQSGGAVMGRSPGDSAVNSYCQAWRTPNVFVVGASAFPQLAACNPTMTTGAIAYRAAEGIIQRYAKAPGLIQ